MFIFSLSNVFIFVVICVNFLNIFLLNLVRFVPVEPDAETESWENTVIYSISLFQFIILALVYSKGKPYRQPFYKDSKNCDCIKFKR